ncbi:MAG: hypothetical protein HYZ53_19150 [Planctomycetes bacterium]|nr:hypothetical protein [Planctomycetota bacterium]
MRELKGDWRDLFHCFMIGLDLRKLLLSFLGGAVTFFVVGLITYFIGTLVNPEALSNPQSVYSEGILPTRLHWFLFNVFCPCLSSIFASSFWGLAYLAIVVPIVSVIWSYFGGAITRIASIEIAKDERLETQKALEFVQQRYTSYFWSLVASVLGFFFFFLVNAVVASLGRVWGVGWLLQPLLMLLLPLALLAGFIMVLVGIGTLFGYPLFYPAISAEGTDSFDAISRGFSYVYTKPWHYLLYQAVSAVYGAACVGFVWTFGYLMIKLTIVSCSFGFGEERMHEFVRFATNETSISSFYRNEAYGGFFASLAAIAFTTWLVIAGGFVLSYGISFFLSAQTMVYFLLRKKVDGIEMNEVFEEKTEETPPLAVAPGTSAPAPAPASAPAHAAAAAAPASPAPVAPATAPAPAGAAKPGQEHKT